VSDWKCKADPCGVVPSDCGWPDCGCDPNVQRVIKGLQEQGWRVIHPDDVEVIKNIIA
jgi:hypothetical protein